MKCDMFSHFTQSCLTNGIGMHEKMHKRIIEVSLDPTEKSIATSTGFSTSYIAYEMQLFWKEVSIHVDAL